MRRLSETTIALIDEVNRLATERQRWRKATSSGEIVSGLARIGEVGQWLAIPRIIPLVLDSRSEVAEAAASVVKQLRVGVRVQDLGVLDRAFREFTPYMHPEYAGWWNMQAQDLKRVALLEDGAAVLSLAMCHPSGYVREEAIVLAGVCADGLEIPFLLLRTNDWVGSVRDRAHSALRARLRPESLPELIAALPMLDQMRKWGRLGDRGFLREIDELLRGQGRSELFFACKNSLDRFVRRAAFRHLVESSGSELREVYGVALVDDDPAIRVWAGRRLCDSEAIVFVQYSEQLLTSSLGSIRAEAAQRLQSLGQSVPWRRLLFDVHPGVRAVAQQAALDDGTPDEHYRKQLALSEGGRLGAALLGLSETGGQGDVEVIQAYLSNDIPRVRRSALRALVNLKADDLIKLSLNALLDSSASVAHSARDVLAGHSGHIFLASVWTAFEQATTSWGKMDALAVLSKLDHWERLPYLLRACTAEYPEVTERSFLYMNRWVAGLNRVFTSPSMAVEGEAREQIQASVFSKPFRREIEGILDSRSVRKT